jgi:hypothetical protein
VPFRCSVLPLKVGTRKNPAGQTNPKGAEIEGLNTRTKIIDTAHAAHLIESGVTAVSGYFDPVIAATAERLAHLRHENRDAPLLVLIATPENHILPVEARLQLVAGLEHVDYVAELKPELRPLIRLEDEHSQQLADLIRHVHSRQQAGKQASGESAGAASQAQ